MRPARVLHSRLACIHGHGVDVDAEVRDGPDGSCASHHGGFRTGVCGGTAERDQRGAAFQGRKYCLLALRAQREAPDLVSRARSHTITPQRPRKREGVWRRAKGAKSGYDAAGGLIPHRWSSNGEERQTGGTLGDPGIGLLRLRPRWPAMPPRRTTRLAHHQRIVLQRLSGIQ